MERQRAADLIQDLQTDVLSGETRRASEKQVHSLQNDYSIHVCFQSYCIRNMMQFNYALIGHLSLATDASVRALIIPTSF